MHCFEKMSLCLELYVMMSMNVAVTIDCVFFLQRVSL